MPIGICPEPDKKLAGCLILIQVSSSESCILGGDMILRSSSEFVNSMSLIRHV